MAVISEADRYQMLSFLVGEKHYDQYRNNALFCRAVDTLIQMLPAMIDGFALNASDEEARQVRLEQLMRQPSRYCWDSKINDFVSVPTSSGGGAAKSTPAPHPRTPKEE